MNEDEIEFIKEPLTTEEGFLNQACMNELESTILNMPKTHDRLSGDPEWSERKDKWTTRKAIVGHFARWACEISPYGVSNGLEDVCKYLYASLKSCNDWNTLYGVEMGEASLCEISEWLHEILYDQGVNQFDSWNEPKKGKAPDIVFTSRHDIDDDPDYGFIDLDALLHNVCVSIRDERRTSKVFDDAFEKEYGKLEPSSSSER